MPEFRSIIDGSCLAFTTSGNNFGVILDIHLKIEAHVKAFNHRISSMRRSMYDQILLSLLVLYS